MVKSVTTQRLGRLVLATSLLLVLGLGRDANVSLAGLDPGRAQAFAVENLASTSTPPNFKVAFIGDSGIGKRARAVLQR